MSVGCTTAWCHHTKRHSREDLLHRQQDRQLHLGETRHTRHFNDRESYGCSDRGMSRQYRGKHYLRIRNLPDPYVSDTYVRYVLQIRDVTSRWQGQSQWALEA